MIQLVFMAPLLAQVVTDNGPPRWTAAEDTAVKAKEHLEQSFRAEDPDKEPLTYTIEGLPMGAKAEEWEGAVVVDWSPTENDVGSYELTLKAADSHGLMAIKKIKLTVEEEVNNFVMPGVEYAFYLPNDEPPAPGAAKLGVFNGARVEFCVWCFTHRTAKRGPSDGKLYFAFDLMASSLPSSSALFNALTGFNLSFDNASRHWFIPYYGGEIGIWYQKATETLGVAIPYLGIHIFSNGNFDIGLRTGVVLPFSSYRFSEIVGLRAGLGINLAFW